MVPLIRASLYISQLDGSPLSKIEKVLRANEELFRHYGIRLSFDIVSPVGEVSNLTPSTGLSVVESDGDDNLTLWNMADPDRSYVVIDGVPIPIEGDESDLAMRLADVVISMIAQSGLIAGPEERQLAWTREPPGDFGAVEYVLEAP